MKRHLDTFRYAGGSVCYKQRSLQKTPCANRRLNAFNLSWKQFRALCAKNEKKQERQWLLYRPEKHFLGMLRTALRSAQSLSSTCDQPEVPEPSWGQSKRAAGRGGGSLIFITWMLECEDKDLNGASKILPWQCCLPQSLLSHPFAGISGDWSGNSLSWSHVSPSAGAAAVPAAGCHCLRMMQCHTRICGSLQDARVQIQAGGLPGSRLD